MQPDEKGRPAANGAAQMTAGEAVQTTIPPAYPRGGDPVRRAILRERLYLRRRAVKMLDQQLADAVDLAEVDYAATGLNLGVREREQAAGVAA